MASISNRQRNSNPLVGMLIGVLLFIAAFPVLYFNEATENLSKAAATAVPSDESHLVEEGQLAYVYGIIHSDTPVQDSFLIGDYIVVNRTVEMYGYEESVRTEDNKEVYSYQKTWVITPSLSTSWQGSATQLPQDVPSAYNDYITNLPVQRSQFASNLTVEGTPLNPGGLSIMNLEFLLPTTEEVSLELLNEGYTIHSNYLYVSQSATGTFSTPQLGDIRISFNVIHQGDDGILLAKKDTNQWAAFTTEQGNTLYRFFNGNTTLQSVVDQLNSEYLFTLWLFRGIGFAMFLFGILLFLNPLIRLLNYVPFVGGIGGFLLFLASLVISFLLSVTTIFVSIVAHNMLLTVVVALIVFAGLVFTFSKRKSALNH